MIGSEAVHSDKKFPGGGYGVRVFNQAGQSNPCSGELDGFIWCYAKKWKRVKRELNEG